MGLGRGVPFGRYSAIPHYLLVLLVPKPSQPRKGNKRRELHNDLHWRCSENMGSSYKLYLVHVDWSNVDGDSTHNNDSIHDNGFIAVDIDKSYCCWCSNLDCDSDCDSVERPQHRRKDRYRRQLRHWWSLLPPPGHSLHLLAT